MTSKQMTDRLREGHLKSGASRVRIPNGFAQGVKLIVLMCLMFVATWQEVRPAHAEKPSTTTPQTSSQVYRYRMKGKVRLLLFWVGKDDVGGGTISQGRRAGSKPCTWEEDLQVLFGSRPERVPGRINRWGYGRERSLWEGRRPRLKQTTFDGFMRHSKGEKISKVRDRDRWEKANSTFWYDSISSIVRPDSAHSEIRVFAAPEDFDYRHPDPIQRYYLQVRDAKPNKKKQLLNNRVYESPYGFLTAVRRLVDSTVDDYEAKDAHWADRRQSLAYVYNSKAYRLSIQGLRRHKTFSLPSKTDSGAVKTLEFSDVAKADFRVVSLKSREKHDFSIWFPLRGPLQGIPLRIVDKPRWWLRLELNLVPETDSHEASIPMPSSVASGCEPLEETTYVGPRRPEGKTKVPETGQAAELQGTST